MQKKILIYSCSLLVAFGFGFGYSAHSSAPTTEVVSDKATGTIRFVVGGNTIAMIDSGGLYVLDDITYGGVLRDGGAKTLDGKLTSSTDAGDAP